MNFVSYLRVSSQKQEQSGLGLEAQRKTILDYVDVRPDANLISEMVEIESGRKDDRPKLAEAIEICRKNRATLLIARLDRLARSVRFISNLMDAKVSFIACDMPTASDFMLHIYSAVAQEERRLISQRTKEALRAAKARGIELGRNGRVLAEQNKAVAMEYAARIAPVVSELKQQGYITVRAITEQLNARSVPSPQSGRWHLASTGKLLNRINSF